MKQIDFLKQFILFLICGLIASFLMVPSFSYGGVIFHICVVGVLFYLISVPVKNPYIPYFIIISVFLAIYIINEYVYAARLSYIRFADFFCIGDAIRVSGGYNVYFDMRVIVHIILACVFMAGGFVLVKFGFGLATRISDKRKEELEKNIRIPGARYSLPVIFIAISLLGLSGIAVFGESGGSGFNMDKEYNRNGLLLTWYYQFKRSGVEEPEGYSHEAAEQILSKYSSSDMVDTDEKKKKIYHILS